MPRRRTIRAATILLAGVVMTLALTAQRISPLNIVTGPLLFSTDNSQPIGNSDATNRPSSLYLAASAITAGSATGLTVNNYGEVRRQIYKATVGTAGCTAAATTCDITIATLPAKAWVLQVLADLTTTYACTATCTTATLTGSLGTSAGGQQFIANFDADAAAAQFGDLSAEVGLSTLVTAANIGVGAQLSSWTGTTTVVFRLASAVGNIGTGAATNLSQGAVTFYVVTEVWP